MATSDDVLRVARSQLGIGERADGTSLYGSWYARLVKDQAFAAAAWCQAFVSWCAREAGVPLEVIPNGAWTVAVADWFDDHGLFTQTPHPGDIVWFDWGGSRNVPKIDHVGWVEAVLADGRVVTIEGNTANAVRRRIRSRSCIAGFGRWPRSGSKPTPKPSPTPSPNPSEVLVKQLPELREGSKGWHVKTLFYLLHARDFGLTGGADDTVFGAPLRDAVKAFQKAAGIKTDGVVGPITWAKLLRL